MSISQIRYVRYRHIIGKLVRRIHDHQKSLLLANKNNIVSHQT